MLESAIRILASADGPEFTVFLSSLDQNALAKSFFQKNSSALFQQYKERLNFRTREEALRRKLIQS